MATRKDPKKSGKPLNKKEMKKTKGGTLNFTSTRLIDTPDTKPGSITFVDPPDTKTGGQV